MTQTDFYLERIAQETQRCADALTQLSIVGVKYIGLVEGYGLNDPKVMEYVKLTTEHDIDEKTPKLNGKRSYEELEDTVESLTKKVARLEEELGQAYADQADRKEDNK